MEMIFTSLYKQVVFSESSSRPTPTTCLFTFVPDYTFVHEETRRYTWIEMSSRHVRMYLIAC